MGIILCVGALVVGSILGVVLKKYLKHALCATMLSTFGYGALTIGMVNIVKANSLSTVLLALIIGTIIGELLGIERHVTTIVKHFMNRLGPAKSSTYFEFYISAIIVFCASGSGMFGAILEGASGDNSILISKGILDLFTALIFGATLGKSLAWISIPEGILLMLFFCLGRYAIPFLTETILQDFMATGGIITSMAGINITKIKKTSVLNATPSLILVILLNIFL